MEHLNNEQLKAIKGGETDEHRFRRFLNLEATGKHMEERNLRGVHGITGFNRFSYNDPYWR